MNKTVLLASPDPTDALTMADYVIVMNDGIVREQGKVYEV